MSIEAGSSLAGTGIGLFIAGPVGALLGAVVAPIASGFLKRALTQKETDRVERMYFLAIRRINENIKAGKPLRKDLDEARLQELTEGTLLKAKDTYEEKKLPFIANLLANAPFTHTPVTDLNQTLIYAEQLSYRQLVIISVIGRNVNNGLHLSLDPLKLKDKKMQLEERVQGIYSDINHLLAIGILGQEMAPGAGPAISSGMFLISPSQVILLYSGRLIFSGMLLDYIDKKDADEIIEILKM